MGSWTTGVEPSSGWKRKMARARRPSRQRAGVAMAEKTTPSPSTTWGSRWKHQLGRGAKPEEIVDLDPAAFVIGEEAADDRGDHLFGVGRVGAAQIGRQLRQHHPPQPVAGIAVGEGLAQQIGGLDDLDPEHLEQPAEAAVLIARLFAEEDVVEQQLLHHRRHHAVDLDPGLVHQHPAQPADFGCDLNHLDNLQP